MLPSYALPHALQPTSDFLSASEGEVQSALTPAALLASSFEQYVSSLSRETKTLKNVAILTNVIQRGDADAQARSVLEELRAFDVAMETLAAAVEHFDKQLDNELDNLSKTKSMIEKSLRQQEEIASLATLLAEQENVCGNNTAQPAQLVSEDDMQRVSKATRGRLSAITVSDALQILVNFTKEKTKALSVPRKHMNKASLQAMEQYTNLKLPEHGSAIFLTESEIRSTMVFQHGEATGKAILHTLRALKRLSMIRSGTESTYIVSF